MEVANWFVQLLLLIATVIAVFVAAFGKDWYDARQRPVLFVRRPRPRTEDCHKTVLTETTLHVGTTVCVEETSASHSTIPTMLHGPPPARVDIRQYTAYYFRVWVENEGPSAARNVQVQARALYRINPDHSRERVLRFLPMNLKWAHTATTHEPVMPRGTGKFLDVFRIVSEDRTCEPEQIELLLEVTPATQSNILPPGQYDLEAQLAAENVEPATITLRIEFDGEWTDDEEEMLPEHASLSVLDSPHVRPGDDPKGR